MLGSDLIEHRLSHDHLAGALMLSREPGWNQNKADWRLMLNSEIAFGLSTDAGRLVASALAVPYHPSVGWIAMVLVTGDFRRRGFATHLMHRCLLALKERGLVPGLDATPEGRQVYLKLGFRDIYTVTRLFAMDPRRPVISRSPTITELRSDDIGRISEYDRRWFGADRSFVLKDLYHRARMLAFVAKSDDEISGYVLGRDGFVGHQIGPVVADDEKTACALICRALSASNGPICLDVVDRHRDVRRELTGLGFTPQFPFFRMLHEHSEPIDDPTRIFVIAGPELG